MVAFCMQGNREFSNHSWKGGVQCVRCGTVKSRESEAQLRETVCQYLQIGQSQGLWLFLDIRHPNLRSLGKEGLGKTPGIPDIIVLALKGFRAGSYGMICPIAIELKAKQGKLSDEQVEMSKRWEQYGTWLTCRSLEEVKAGLVSVGVRVPEEA